MTTYVLVQLVIVCSMFLVRSCGRVPDAYPPWAVRLLAVWFGLFSLLLSLQVIFASH
jgi:hypothetical protein